MEGLAMKDKFWQDKCVLITGHTGFKGSWLSLWLQKKGASVIGYALDPPTKPNFFELGNISKEMTSISGDVRNLEHLKSVISKYRPEIIIHLAAQAILRYSYNHPVDTFSTNILGTINVLEAVRHSDSVRVLVCITSDKCYENKEWYWGYRENDKLGGSDPYSASKASAELAIAAYRSSYFPSDDYMRHGIAVASTRAGNVIGGGDWAKDRLIPDIMRAILEKRPVIIRSPNSTRPWQHVLEPLNGYLLLAQFLWERGAVFADSWNFGPYDQEARPVSWIVEHITDIWGEGASWELDKAQHPHENTYLKLDCSKANQLLDWAPKLQLPICLEWVVDWYKSFQRNEDMRSFSESQINSYENLER
jgi:CDP-glucose 4,6-dehydratase